MLKNFVFHACTKHIKKACHFIHNQVKKGRIILGYMRSKDQIANVFTKAMIKVRFNELKSWSQLKTHKKVDIE
jgi:hypothetical protein